MNELIDCSIPLGLGAAAAEPLSERPRNGPTNSSLFSVMSDVGMKPCMDSVEDRPLSLSHARSCIKYWFGGQRRALHQQNNIRPCNLRDYILVDIIAIGNSQLHNASRTMLISSVMWDTTVCDLLQIVEVGSQISG